MMAGLWAVRGRGKVRNPLYGQQPREIAPDQEQGGDDEAEDRRGQDAAEDGVRCRGSEETAFAGAKGGGQHARRWRAAARAGW